MSRAKNDIPSYRRHKASGQAVVTLNGVDHYLGPYGTPQSKAEYDRVIAEWMALGRRLLDQRRGADSSEWLMKELILGYFGHCVATLPDVEVYKIKLALKPVRELYGETPARDFGPVAFKAVRQRMVDSGLTVTTIRQRLGIIRRMIGWGVENERLPGDALHKLQAVAGLRAGQTGVKLPKKVLPVSEGDIEAILPCLAPTVRTMVELQALTGARPGEVCRMTTGQIDRSGNPWLYRPTQHKTASRGKDRVILLGPRAQELLKPWLKADPDQPLFSPRDARDHYDSHRRHSEGSTAKRRESWRRFYQRKARKRRFVPRERAMYSTPSYGNAVANACVMAGIPVFRPNRIRHTYATKVRRAFGLEASQVLLGHTKADVTQIYAERDMALARDVAQRIG
jgi:integrase